MRPGLLRGAGRRAVRSKSTTAAAAAAAEAPVIAYDDAPGPGYLFPFQTAIYGNSVLHKRMYEKYGREHGVALTKDLTGKKMLYVFHHEDLRHIYQNEGKNATGSKLQAIDEYWIKKSGAVAENLPYAITSSGEMWRQARDLLGPGIYTDAVAKYEPAVAVATREAVAQAHHYSDAGLDTWALHATFDAFCSLAIGKNPATTDPENNTPMKQITDLEAESLGLALQIEFTPSFMHPRNARERFARAYDRMIEIVSPEVRSLFAKDDIPNCWFKDLRDVQGVSEAQLEHLMPHLFSAAIGTTSVALRLILVALTYHPEAQAKVYEEVRVNLKGDASYSKAGVKMPYLEAFIRETNRVYPTVLGLGMRALNHDIVLPSSRVHVPAGSVMLMAALHESIDTRFNADADQFRPDRFLRENIRARKGCPMAAKMDSPITKDNFGSGGHTCLGKRAAELELRMLVTKLLKKYELVLDPADQPVPGRLKHAVLNTPDPFPSIKLVPRESS